MTYSTWRIANSLEMWRAANVEPQSGAPRRLLDIACGCAIKSFALAQQDSALHVTCVDTPCVLPVARALAEHLGLIARTEFIAADLLTADFGADRYDLCLLGQITDYLTPAQNCDLFRRVQCALKPGGTLMLDAPMTGEHSSEWTAIVSLLLWTNGGGETYGFAEYAAWLQAAGFTQVAKLSKRWLCAIRVGD